MKGNMTLGYKGIGIRKSLFVIKTQFLLRVLVQIEFVVSILFQFGLVKSKVSTSDISSLNHVSGDFLKNAKYDGRGMFSNLFKEECINLNSQRRGS